MLKTVDNQVLDACIPRASSAAPNARIYCYETGGTIATTATASGLTPTRRIQEIVESYVPWAADIANLMTP